MNKLSIKKNLLIALSISFISFSSALFSESLPQIDTILTDQYSPDHPGEAKESFAADTAKIYILWQSEQLKPGQKIKSVWIAEDTNNVAPPNYKIDEAELTIDNNMKEKILSNLPGAYFGGKFALSKPDNGWPAGKYHMDIYVDGTLVKTVKFTVASAAQPASEQPKAAPEAAPAPTAEKKAGSWGAISVDTKTHDTDSAYGVGGGSSKEEAGQNAQKFCAEAGGEKCTIVVSYQQCGAYALSKEHQGVGVGSATTKSASEAMAKGECKDDDCQIIASDCN